MEKTTHTREYTLLRKMLRELRENNGVTQVYLAQKLHETQSVISKFERGERRLDLIQIRAFCKAMGVSVVDFIADFEQRLAARGARK